MTRVLADHERTNWLLVFMLLLAGLFAGAQFGKLALTLEVLRQIYPDRSGAVAALVSIVGVVGIVLGAVAGAVVARIGIRRTILFALIAGGALSLIQSVLPALPVFFALRVLEGVAHLAIVVAIPTLMTSISSDADRPVVMGIWAAFFGIAMASLALILPYLLTLGGMPAVLIAHGGGMLVMAVLLMPLLPRANAASEGHVSYFNEHQLIYTNPRLLIPGAGFVWYTLLYIALLAVLPIALDLQVWAITALPLVSIVGTLWGGVLAKRVSPDRLVVAGFVLTAITGGCAWALSPAIWPFFVMFFVMAFIPAGCFASIPHFNLAATDRARATGGIAQLGNVGTSLGTPLFVLGLDAGGLSLVSALLVGLCAIGAGLTLWLRGRIT